MTENNNFLPETYEMPRSESKYMKLEQGENKVRVLSAPIFGWEAWKMTDEKNTPIRFPMDKKPVDLRGFTNQRITHFWAMPIWNFQLKCVQVMEITQKTILKSLESLARNEDWGSPLKYNITIKREGTKIDDTEYFVNPSPHSDLSPEIKEAWEEVQKNGFDLNALFYGGDPFAPEEVDSASESSPF